MFHNRTPTWQMDYCYLLLTAIFLLYLQEYQSCYPKFLERKPIYGAIYRVFVKSGTPYIILKNSYFCEQDETVLFLNLVLYFSQRCQICANYFDNILRNNTISWYHSIKSLHGCIAEQQCVVVLMRQISLWQ